MRRPPLAAAAVAVRTRSRNYISTAAHGTDANEVALKPAAGNVEES